MLIYIFSVALPDSTDDSLAGIRSDIKQQMKPSVSVLLSILTVFIKANHYYAQQSSVVPPISRLGNEPLQLTMSNSIQLVRDVLVAQRRFHQPKSTARAVRQANRLARPVTASIANISPSPPEETPVRDALMKRLTDLVASGPNKTTGIDRQVRHIGHYVVHSVNTSIRATQKATLQDVAALVCTIALPLFTLLIGFMSRNSSVRELWRSGSYKMFMTTFIPQTSVILAL